MSGVHPAIPQREGSTVDRPDAKPLKSFDRAHDINQGIDRANRPLFWRPYADSVPDILVRSRPVSALLARYPERAAGLRSCLAEMKADEATARFLPLIARRESVILVDVDGRVLGQLQADGFF